ncbi:MAG: YaiI/YqxD family protein [Alphaproteobacteria bacterium]
MAEPPALYVDADACPVKAEILRVAERCGILVYMVSGQGTRPTPHARVHHVVAGDGFDAADDWIAARVQSGDIVVTADILLAKRCLERGARVVAPTGRPFTTANIGSAIAMRALNADLRDMGAIAAGGRTFSKQDRSRFLNALDAAIHARR